MKASELISAVTDCIKATLVAMIEGEPGIGKSEIVKQLAQAIGFELLITHPSVKSREDYGGLPFPNAQRDAAEFLPYGDLQVMLTAKKPLLVFIDDLGQAPHAVQAAIMQLIQAREINGMRISDKVRFVAATNSEKHRAGVQRMITPLAGRGVHLHLDVDFNEWCAWALGQDLPTEVLQFIRFRPDLLLKFSATTHEKAQPSPRTWEFLARLVAMKPNPDTEYELYSGCVGQGAATEFMGFLKIFRELPDPDAVIMDPKSAEVPKQPATLYALTGALARRAGADNLDRVVEYANRMPAEFSVMLMRDALMRDKSLAKSRAYVAWASKHAEVLL